MKIVIKKKVVNIEKDVITEDIIEKNIKKKIIIKKKDVITEDIIEKNIKKKIIIKKKDVKKNGFKLGQKYKIPDLNDPSRKFYTSLLSQKKDSKMALKWCLEHGLIDDDQIDYVFTLAVGFSSLTIT
jgi:hypothetical protein